MSSRIRVEDDRINFLLDQIEEAFADETYPGDELVAGNCPCNTLEVAGLIERSREKKWQDIPVNVIDYHKCSLPFLLPESYPYYIPAYMTCSFEMQYRYKDTDLLWFTVLSLCSQKQDLDDHVPLFETNQQHKHLDYLQKITIKRFLRESKNYFYKEDGDTDTLALIDRTLCDDRLYLNYDD